MGGIIEGPTGVTDSGVVISVGITVGAEVDDGDAVVAIEATVGAEVADDGAVVVTEATVGAEVADGGAVVVTEATVGAEVADGGAVWAVEVTAGTEVTDGDHKRNFDTKTMATMTAQIIAPKPATNFQCFHVGIVGGATNFRLWRVMPAPVLSRSSSRICRACSSDCRASEKFPSQIAFVPSW
jgi:hypothetical protein